MERDQVSSSTIVSIGYDFSSETLEVEFQHGGIYQYYNVPQTIYEPLMELPSKGQFLQANIRNAFPYSQV